MKPNRLPLYTLWLTYLLSHIGNILASLAIPWFVLQTTGSAAQTGITAFFGIIPTVIGMVVGGTIVDRVGYKPASVIADIASGFFLALIPLFYVTVGLPFPLLLFLVFMGALLDAPGGSARISMVPELAAAAEMSLDRANAIDSVIQRATVMLGAPLAGILIATMGAINLLWLDAATFFFSAVAIWLVIPSGLLENEKTPEEEEEASPSLMEDFTEGLRFLRQDTLMVMVIITIMVMNAVDGAVYNVVLPVQMNNLYGDETGAAYMGWLLGALGFGAVVGSMVYSVVAERLPRRLIFLIGLCFAPVYLIFLRATPAYWLLLASFAVGGFVVSPLNPILHSVMFERIPKTMRARVFGLTSAGAQVFMPLGVLATGFLVERFSVSTTLALLIFVYFVTVITFLLNPQNRHIERAALPAVPPPIVPEDTGSVS